MVDLGCVQRLKDVVHLERVEAELLKVVDVAQGVVTQEDDPTLLVEVELVDHALDSLDWRVGRVYTERLLETRSDVSWGFLEADERGIAEIEALGMASNKLVVDKMLVFLNPEVAGLDDLLPVLAVSTGSNAD